MGGAGDHEIGQDGGKPPNLDEQGQLQPHKGPGGAIAARIKYANKSAKRQSYWLRARLAEQGQGRPDQKYRLPGSGGAPGKFPSDCLHEREITSGAYGSLGGAIFWHVWRGN